MRLSDLWRAKVRTLDGDSLGRVHDVHCDGGRVTAIVCGAASIVERLTAREHGRRVPWDEVVRVERKSIVVTGGAPRDKAKFGASRSRQGTRRPSAPRSRR
jgi:sporulation protein YlmC with PRC-barrel domain